MCVPGCQEAIHQALSRRRWSRRLVFATAAGFAATAMSLSSPVVAAPRPARRVVDLTHTMSVDIPTFDGTPGIAMMRLKELKRDGYNLYEWRLNEHSGTHLDAPTAFF